MSYLSATEQLSNDLASICKPLQNYSGFNHFCYTHVDNSGKTFIISTNNALMEYLDDIQSYKDDPHLINPSNMLSGFATWDTNQGATFSAILAEYKNRFDVSHGISYIEKGSDGHTIFGLAASHDHCPNDMLNDLGYIKKFFNYLKQEASPILQIAREEHAIDLAALKKDFHTQPGIIPNNKKKKDALVQMLMHIGLVDPRLANITLTPQERRCVKLCIQGKTAKQVGHELNLSYRTVESYLETVKEKLGIYYKRELFDLKDSLLELGMLD